MDTEKLLETILDLERSRKNEQDLRVESEILLDGLRTMTKKKSREEVFGVAIDTLRSVIDFDEAFILQQSSQTVMNVLISSSSIFEDCTWKPASAFKRALTGNPMAAFDVRLIPEWQNQSQEILDTVGSALHIGLFSSLNDSLLVLTHSQPRFFGPKHVKQAIRFSPLASQAIFTLELQHSIIQRDRFFQLSADLMAIVDFDGTIMQYNDIWPIILGYSEDEITDGNIVHFIHEDEKEAVQVTLNHTQNTGEKLFVEVRFRKKSGEYLWFSCSCVAYHDERLCYIVARDITDRVIYEERLAHEARHDYLTGLYNRRGFMDFAKSALAHANRYPGHRFAICYLDLDEFKAINDTYGHEHGDKVLITFAKCLLQSVRETDVAARLGGDEFALLLDEIQAKDEVIQVAERIQRELVHPHTINGIDTQIAASMGIVLSSARFTSLEEMLRKTDKAMYEAKAHPSKRYFIY